MGGAEILLWLLGGASRDNTAASTHAPGCQQEPPLHRSSLACQDSGINQMNGKAIALFPSCIGPY